jgi:hypothetical protein
MERIEALITSKMKGEVAQVKEEKPKKPVAKSMMEALRATTGSVKKANRGVTDIRLREGEQRKCTYSPESGNR